MSGGQEDHGEEAPSPHSAETSPQSPSKHTAEEETPDGEGFLDSVGPQITQNLMALTSHRSKRDGCVSTHSLSDLCFVQQDLENSGGTEDESDESPGAKEAGDDDEENTNISASSAATSSVQEQDDVRSSQETRQTDEADVNVQLQI